MKYIYTCFKCAFPFAVDETEVPEFCPSCCAPKSQYLVEPWNGSIEERRIHVDPPEPDPNWNKYDVSYHHCKQFPAGTRHGRVRRFVLGYDDAKVAREFYENVFGWDIIDVEHADKENPLMFCATGPGQPNWEPRFSSFGYGFLKAKCTDETGKNPKFVVEVDKIDDILAKVESYGGKVLKGKYTVEGNEYAVLQDSEGNPFYIWETPADVTFKEPESQNYYKWDRIDTRKYDRMYKSDFDPKSKYPFRAPKKFPEKDLHGRVRYGGMKYNDFERFQKFWVDLFGWDMFDLSKAFGGNNPDGKTPMLIIGTGPTYETWEGVAPGHMNMNAGYCEGEVPPVGYMMEIHMNEPIKCTADKVIKYGGTVLGDVPEEGKGWAEAPPLPIRDPFGNEFSLWRCPSSRTWDEAEAGWDWD